MVDGIHRPSVGAVSVGVLVKVGLEDGFQGHPQCFLDNPVANGWNAPSALPPPPNPLRDLSPSPIPITRSVDRRSRSSSSAEGSIPISSSDSLTGTMPPSP